MQRLISRRGAEIQLLVSLSALVLAAAFVGYSFVYIRQFYQQNPYLNSMIVVVFALGIAYALYSILRIQREFGALRKLRKRLSGTPDEGWIDRLPPKALPISMLRERMAVYSEQVRQGSAPDPDSHADRVYNTLNLRTSTTRYISGLLVFLGLLGTFIGLLMSIGSIRDLIVNLPTGEGEAANADFFGTLKTGLAAPLGGMGTAFSTSVFGLSASLVMGFLHLQLASAQGRYIAQLETFDSAFLKPAYRNKLGVAGTNLEGTVEFLDSTQRVMKQNIDRLLVLMERSEGIQANYRQVLGALSKEIEIVNAGISRLGTNQDLIREASTNMVELTYGMSDNHRLTVAELKNINESIGRLNGLLREQQQQDSDRGDDLARMIRSEISNLSAAVSAGREEG